MGMIDLAALAAEFPRAAVSWRAQSVNRNKDKALALAYIDARDVMDRLDMVCGPANWQDEYEETPKGRVFCRLSIRMEDGGWVTKSDGAGATDVEAEKGAISDALKRAAVRWGIGRYLYALDSPWVPCEVNDQGKWKSWKADPWTCIRNLPPEPRPKPDARPLHEQAGPMPTAQEPVPERDPATIATSLVRLVNMATTKDELDHVLARPKFDSAWEWLSIESPRHSSILKEVVEAKRTVLEEASLPPLPPQIAEAMNGTWAAEGPDEGDRNIPGAFAS